MPSPFVLAHGIARFDQIFARFGHHVYFKGIPGHLARHGFDAHRASVSFAGSVDQRAAELKSEVARILGETGADQAHIIAHSMGGLDARHMIVDHDMAGRVASLTTIGTPHLGTSFADRGLEAAGGIIEAAAALGIDIEGFRDLARAPCREFNARAEPAEARNGVVYQTYASSQERARVVAPLQPSWRIIREQEQDDNDGLVAVRSQLWTDRLGAGEVSKPVAQHTFPFGADHLNQTGSWDPNELAALGFFRFFRRRGIGSYERAVRDVYLQIARSVTRPRAEPAAAADQPAAGAR